MARIGQKSSRWVNPASPSAGSGSSGPPAMQQNATKCNTFSLLALFPASKPQPMQENVRPQALHRPIQEAPLSRRPRRTCLRTSPNFQRTIGPHPNVLRRSGRKLFPTQIVIHTFGSMSSGRNDFWLIGYKNAWMRIASTNVGDEHAATVSNALIVGGGQELSHFGGQN